MDWKIMEELVCENCGSQDIGEVDGIITCKNCGTKYSKNPSKNIGIDEELREREIRRLTGPIIFPKRHSYMGGHRVNLPKDVEGNIVERAYSFGGPKFIIEPKSGILSDDEILKYAGDSKVASRIRLKRGIGYLSDKIRIYIGSLLFIWGFIGGCGSLLVFSLTSFRISGALLALIFTLGIPTLFTLYVLRWKDYKDKTYDLKEEIKHPNPTNNSNTRSNNEKNIDEVCNELKNYEKDINNLRTQYRSKEETTKKIISEYFPPPQLTYDMFIGEIDIWREIFFKQVELALNIINLAPECTPKVDEELKNRINTLESIVKKMDDLVVELAINLGNSSREATVGEVNELITGMQNVIDSIKEYDY
jgi:hypothetical protein